MKIVDRATFLSMPSGTVYAKAETPPTLDFGPIGIKGESTSSDFWSQRLIGDFEGDNDCRDWAATYERLVAGGDAVPDFYIEGRDGLYDEGQLFAVFDAQDVHSLIGRLERALAEGYDRG